MFQNPLQYTKARSYGRNELVYYKGNLYVSLIEDNDSSVHNTSAWKKVALDKVAYQSEQGLPIGTILTVPKNLVPTGFIKLRPGQEFNQNTYPALFKALGSNRFPELPVTTRTDLLPVGTILHGLGEEELPVNWLEWNHRQGNLRGTELLKLFRRIALTLPTEYRQVWDDAVRLETFPDLPADFFLRVIKDSYRYGHIGAYEKDKTVANRLTLKETPVVKAYSYSVGSDNTNSKEGLLNSNVNTDGVVTAPLTLEATKVVYGDTAVDYQTLFSGVTLPKQRETVLHPVPEDAMGTEVAPKHLLTKLIVKVDDTPVATNDQLVSYVIKAFDSYDIPETDLRQAAEHLQTKYDELLDSAQEAQRVAAEAASAAVAAVKSELKETSDEEIRNLKQRLKEFEDKYTLQWDEEVTEVLEAFKEKTNTTLEESSTNLETKLCDLQTRYCKVQEEVEDTLRDLVARSEQARANHPDIWVLYADLLDGYKKQTSKYIEALQDYQLIKDTLKEQKDEFEREKERTQERFVDVREWAEEKLNALDTRLTQKINALEAKLDRLLTAQTVTVSPKDKPAITTKYFGEGEYYLGKPAKWLVINGVKVPAYED